MDGDTEIKREVTRCDVVSDERTEGKEWERTNERTNAGADLSVSGRQAGLTRLD